MCRGIIFDRLSDSQRIGKLIGIGQDSFYGFRAQIMFSQFTEEICQIFLWIQMIQLSRDQNRKIICRPIDAYQELPVCGYRCGSQIKHDLVFPVHQCSNERFERRKVSELCAGTGCRASNDGANDSGPAPIFKELTGKSEKRLGALITL